jgi:hypothetical protein
LNKVVTGTLGVVGISVAVQIADPGGRIDIESIVILDLNIKTLIPLLIKQP